MLPRFCLYGFLKNQRYFEPFLFLAFLEKGASFFGVGLLIAIREITVNLLEVPSGAAADLFGRRRTMILSFAAYFASFLTFGQVESFPGLAAAMVLFGIGEAFRSGTHKTMIFHWLELEGRTDEKTRIYGLTRSFSKLGSALSALVAAGLVFAAADYNSVFLWSLVPCGLSILNLLTYPAAIDPPPARPASLSGVWTHVRATLSEVVRRRRLRRLAAESMGYNGLFFSAKDYLQPVLVTAVLVWFGRDSAELADAQRTALLAGPVYFVLFLAAATASLNAHRWSAWAGDDDAGAGRLWSSLALAFAAMALADATGLHVVTMLAFVALHVLQNLWRPILTSRIYAEVDKTQGATVLSLESQAHRLAAVILAPTFGWLADTTSAFWPMACVGLAIAVLFRSLPHGTGS